MTKECEPDVEQRPPVRQRWHLSVLESPSSSRLLFASICLRAGFGISSRWKLIPENVHMVHGIIITSLLVYTILIAIPFVPSVEIGLGMIILLGADLAPLVYMFTVIGCSLSFIAGRLIPESYLRKFLEDLSLTRASRFVEEVESLDREQRLSLLLSHAPAKFIPNSCPAPLSGRCDRSEYSGQYSDRWWWRDLATSRHEPTVPIFRIRAHIGRRLAVRHSCERAESIFVPLLIVYPLSATTAQTSRMFRREADHRQLFVTPVAAPARAIRREISERH